MNAHYTQDNNIGSLQTTLGKDVFLLLALNGTDYVNDLFTYKVRALIREELDYDAVLGTHATVALTTVNHGATHFDGIVTEIDWLKMTESGEEYELTLRPWFYLAGKRRQQRIFHDMSVDEILTEVLNAYSDFGDSTYKLELTGNYPKLEYTVQYRESDLAFACRLMERYGISYHFVHDLGNHRLVLTDTMEAMSELPGLSREYRPVEEHFRKEEEHFWQWRKTRGMTTGKVKLTDYNFKTPTANLLQEQVGDADYDHGRIESYDYPGVYLDAGEGADVTNLRTVQERSTDHRHRVVGDVMGLKAGMRCAASGEFAEWMNGEEYLCLEARHSFASESYRAGQSGSDAEDEAYKGAYVMTPVSAPFAPLRKTREPIIQGPQTARVVGEGEIDCDEYGRILVRFHWDIADAYSMRCRVSQSWASKGWGGMVIPRIGMEVIVEHLEGDPDKPIVTGCVYNGKNDVPYPLPAHKTKSVFRSDTHQGSGFNEFMFEDEKDRELIYMHGQKDQEIEILNNRSKTIGNDETNVITRDRSQSVGQDETMSVGRDQAETVGRNVMYNVGENQQEKYGKDHIHYVGNIHKQDIFADHLRQVGGNYEEIVKGKYTLNVNQTITNNTGTHTLMAYEKFVIKGPGGKITIDASGITLEAAKINLKGAVSMGGGGGAQVPTLQGAANQALPLVEECLKQKEE
ncbi:type VI secretion system tip protein VgrG [Alphaproteobacteria bacterium KMM 3653]|uniref:Type VI secretion system tip protein VgrG n=1 Tax=Harenicola maris TaxID=2841044 RepID=A0AAP2CT75_9RHOB|nr:type VI secretion system tip protein VgrG [Harenicola maris]